VPLALSVPTLIPDVIGIGDVIAPPDNTGTSLVVSPAEPVVVLGIVTIVGPVSAVVVALVGTDVSCTDDGNAVVLEESLAELVPFVRAEVADKSDEVPCPVLLAVMLEESLAELVPFVRAEVADKSNEVSCPVLLAKLLVTGLVMDTESDPVEVAFVFALEGLSAVEVALVKLAAGNDIVSDAVFGVPLVMVELETFELGEEVKDRMDVVTFVDMPLLVPSLVLAVDAVTEELARELDKAAAAASTADTKAPTFIEALESVLTEAAVAANTRVINETIGKI